MNDFAELMVGLLVCGMPPVLLLGGLLAYLRFSRNDGTQRNDERIHRLEAAVGELRGQNLTLLHRLSYLERYVASGAVVQSPPVVAPSAEVVAAPVAVTADLVPTAAERATLPDAGVGEPSAAAASAAPEGALIAPSDTSPSVGGRGGA
ncbi:MAG: hypothetical protein KF729_12490, partial [Sandaracinaceae bacterium]|nr:hypothetical protein [Sandaracinaceae bacterium]